MDIHTKTEAEIMSLYMLQNAKDEIHMKQSSSAISTASTGCLKQTPARGPQYRCQARSLRQPVEAVEIADDDCLMIGLFAWMHRPA